MSFLQLDSLLALVDPEGKDAEAAFRFSQNAKFRRFGRARDALTDDSDDDTSSEVDLGAQIIDPGNAANVHLVLNFDPGPKDVSKGFVFGNDPKTCDVLLAKDKFSGVSGNQFSISVDWQTGNPLVTCLTPKEGGTGIRILSGGIWVPFLRNAWKVIDPGIPTTIKISEENKLVVYSPGREHRDSAYGNNLQTYFKKFQDSVPEMAHLRLYDSEPTPLLISRGRGLTGMEYFTTKTVVGKNIVSCEARSHQNWVGDSELFNVKRFRYVSEEWPEQAKTVLTYLRQLRHRHIIVPEDIITDTTEYMPVYFPEPAETLADRQGREPLTEIDAGEVLAQVFEGLKFLHKNHIVHGGLFPGNIRIKHSGPWSIRLSDIGLDPYVDLEDSEERELYKSQPRPGHNSPGPLQDTWSAGVVGLSLLSPGGLPSRSHRSIRTQTQHAWTRSLVKEAEAFHAAEGPGPGGKRDAALFLTRVLKHAHLDRLTAEECLQDPWIQLWRLPLSYDRENSQDFNDPFFYVPGNAGPPSPFSEAGSAHEEVEDEEGSGEDTESEDPRNSTSKGKQPQKSYFTGIAPSSDPHGQQSASSQSHRCSGGTSTGFCPTSVESSESVSRQASITPSDSTHRGEHTQDSGHPGAENPAARGGFISGGRRDGVVRRFGRGPIPAYMRGNEAMFNCFKIKKK